MLPGLGQALVLTLIIVLSQTTKRVHSEDAKTNLDDNNYVLNLGKDNFDETIKNNKHVLVKFVAPWCGHCKTLAPAYAAAAKQLAETGNDVKLASVDATIEQDLAQKYDVSGYPTIKFFSDGTTFEYTGGRSKDEMVNWLKKKTGPAAETLKNLDDYNRFKHGLSVCVIGVFKDPYGEAANAYLHVAKNVDGVTFGITSSEDLFKELKMTKDGIVLLKTFDEGRNDLESTVDEATIHDFIQNNQLPLVNDFNADTAQKIFAGEIKIHVLLFASKNDKGYPKLRQDMEKVAKDFRGRALFVYVDSSDDDNERVLEFFGLQKTDPTSIRLISLKDDMKKYKPETNEFNEKNLSEFVKDFFESKLKPHLLTQEIPEDWDKTPVKTLVGKNFEQVAKDKTKTVLVSFVAPWCHHCKQMVPVYEQLAEKYKDKSDIVIAKMDATANEIEDIKIQSFPTIKLFLKVTNEMIEFQGERTVDGLSKFIDSQGFEGATIKQENVEHVEEAEEEEDVSHEEL